MHFTNRLFNEMVAGMSADALSTTLAALADPIRRAILARLREGEATVAELSRSIDANPTTATKHLKVLRSAGLVDQSGPSQWRTCRLEGTPLRGVADWVEGFRPTWEPAATPSVIEIEPVRIGEDE